jgi:hypothetical protein
MKWKCNGTKSFTIIKKDIDSPLWQIYRGERRTTLGKAYGIKESAIDNMLRNVSRTWGTNWEHDKNPLRTWCLVKLWLCSFIHFFIVVEEN